MWLHLGMSWKETTNKALDRRLGLQLVRSSSLAQMESQAAAERTRRPKPRRPAKKPLPPPIPDKRADSKVTGLPADYGAEFVEIWGLVRHRTMTNHEKGYFLHQAVRYLVHHQIPGAMVECGVWRGGSMLNVAHTLTRLSSADRELYLFDTFSGMSEPTDRDVHLGRRTSATDLMETYSRDSKLWAIASLEDVKEGFETVDYPRERVHFVKGKVEDTIPEQAPEEISLLRLDTDWYASTKHELAHLYSRLAPGGILIVDDYGTWKGSKDATDEFLVETGEPLMLVRAGGGRTAVKPGLSSRVATT